MVEINIPDFIESIRKIMEDNREEKAVRIAKSRLRVEFIKFGANETRTPDERALLGALQVELDAATTKEEIYRIIEKLNKLRKVNF